MKRLTAKNNYAKTKLVSPKPHINYQYPGHRGSHEDDLNIWKCFKANFLDDVTEEGHRILLYTIKSVETS